MMRLILFLISWLYFSFLNAQDTCYQLYTLEEFTRLHFSDPDVFYKTYIQSAKYSAVLRENMIEGIAEVELINHSEFDFEVSVTNGKSLVFEKSIYETILKTRKHWLNINTFFIVKFCVEYDLVYEKEKRKYKSDSCNLKIIDWHLTDLGDTTFLHNSNQLSYWPQIMASDDQVVYDDLRKYHRTESIEQLLELAVKRCCRTSIQLSHLVPPLTHSCPTGGKEYVPIADYIGVIFNKKGYISELRPHGKLEKRIDSQALFNILKNIRFYPALFKTTPVDAILEFKAE